MNLSTKSLSPFRVGHSRFAKGSFPYTELGYLLLVSVLLVARQFINPHFSSCVIDDSILHMSWVRQFAQVLSEGIWLPRWLPDSNGGYGSPVFIFYSPLVYYVTALLHWGTGSVIASMKLARFVGLFLSGLAMLTYARSLVSQKTALVVAIVYLAIPFHVLDITYWTLYAETWAWIWFPLILFFLCKIPKSRGNRIVYVAGFSLCYAGLILTHLVSAYMFSFVVGGYALSCSPKNKLLENMGWILSGVLAGLALAAFFLFPAFYEQKFVHLEYSTLLPEFDFRNTFLFFPNEDLMRQNQFQANTIGMLQSVTLVQGLWILFSVGVAFRKKGLHLSLRRELSFSLVTMLLCLFLMSRPSVWVWQLVPGLPQIQFSTRWLSIYTLMAALIIGVSFESYRFGLTGAGKWLMLAHFSMAFFAGIGSLLMILGGCFLKEEHTRLGEEHAYNAPEYNPRVMQNWKQRVLFQRDPQFVILRGQAQVRVDHWQAQNRQLSLEAETPIRLKLRLYDYPGWNVTVDGEKTLAAIDSASGAVLVDVLQGRHLVQIRFENTWWRKIAIAISSFTALGLISLLLWKQRHSHKVTPDANAHLNVNMIH